MTKQPISLNAEVVLLCERAEIAQVLQAYIRYAFGRGVNLPSVQLINVGALANFAKVLPQLGSMHGAESVCTVLCLADGANEARARREQLANACSQLDLPLCAQGEYYLFPGLSEAGRWQRGYLEDVLLRSLRPELLENKDFLSFYNLASEYLVCVNRQREQKLSNEARHLLYTMLAATQEWAGKSLGEAAMAGAFDFSAPQWEKLLQLLQKIAKK